jgi:hypothetical protein
LPFLFDWKLEDGQWRVFTKAEVDSQLAIGVQKFPEEKFRSVISVSMMDERSLSVMYYIDNTIVTYSGQSGRILKTLIADYKLPTDATFYKVPGYDANTFPFAIMEVASKGEVFLTNTRTTYSQQIISLIKEHSDGKLGHFFFTFEPKSMKVSIRFLSHPHQLSLYFQNAQEAPYGAGAPSQLFYTEDEQKIESIASFCLNYMEQQKDINGEKMTISYTQYHFGPDMIKCLRQTGYLPPAHVNDFINLMKDHESQVSLRMNKHEVAD